MDDLLDLDFASANKPIQPTKPNPQANYGPGRTAFDYLAAQPPRQASIPTIRATTPLNATKPGPKPAAASANAGGDAFAELFGSSSSSSTTAPPNGSSMAEKLQRESAAKLAGYGGPASRSGTQSPLAGLSSTLSPQSRSASPALSPSVRSNTPSSLRSPTSRTASPVQPPAPGASAAADPWDFDALAAATPAGRQSPLAPINKAQSPVDDLFDMGFDGSRFAPAAATTGTTNVPPPAPAAPDEFDLLDAFAGPAVPAGAKVSPNSARSPPPAAPTPRTHSPTVRSSSPPPHIVGQLVEMGFSPDAATAALAATVSSSSSPGGGDWNLDAALEVLVEQQKADDMQRRKQREADEWGDEDDIRIGRRRSWQFEDDDGAAEAERARRAAAAAASSRPSAPSNGTSAPRAAPSRRTDDVLPERPARTRPSATTTSDPALARDQTDQLKEQATEVLAQAQKIGLSMFKSANAYWGEGKKALQKALEEQRAAAAGARAGGAANSTPAGSKGVANGKPKWWREGMDEDDQAGSISTGPSSSKGKGRAEEPPEPSFKDSDDEEEGPESATRRPVQPAQRRQEPPRAQLVADSSAAPGEYRSPFRRAKAAPAPVPLEADLLSGAPAPAPAPVSSQPAAPRRAPAASPAPRAVRQRAAAPQRPRVDVTASAVAAAAKHKSTAAEHFKLGRFGEATSAFTLALNALPEDWIGCVPLLNNRAQSRLKSGEEKEAAVDCTTALGILLAPTKGDVDLGALEAETGALPAEMAQLYAGGASIDLRDQLGKSLARRAKAYEANEKWSRASEDWQKLLTLGDETVTRGAGGVKMISDGVARCRQMLDGPSASNAATRSATRPAASAAPKRAAPSARKPSTPVQGSGEAVRALQAQQAASAAEDDQRLQLKDQVDAQIASWKGGKETNLRALIASLDSVLWPTLGWKTVGMHELITDNQLKIRYVRAIAKVHPDKLNAQNTTLEQRMIAALVFAALNDAWNGMK